MERTLKPQQPSGMQVPRGKVRLGAGLPLAGLVAVIATVVAPDKGFWILLGTACLVCAARGPQLLCYALVPAVTLDGVLTLHLGPLRVGPTDFIVGALGVALLARTVSPARQRWSSATERSVSSPSRMLRVLAARQPDLALIGGTLLAYLMAIVLSGAVASSRTDVLKEVLKWSEVGVVVVAGAVFLSQRGRVYTMICVMISVGVSQALLGYGQWVLAAGDIGQSGSGIRVFGTFDQPNPYAAYLNLSLPLALALVLLARGARERWLAGGAAVLLLGTQGLAASRGGLLALAVAVAVMLVVVVGLERVAAPVVVAGGALVSVAWATHVLPVALQSRILRLLRVEGVSLTGPVNDANFSSVERLAHWVAGVRMFVAHPLLGVGAGNYSVAYAHYRVAGWYLALGHAHDYYINAAAETGVVGLFAFVGFTTAILLVAWRGARWERARVAHVGRTKTSAWVTGGGALVRAHRWYTCLVRGARTRLAEVAAQRDNPRTLCVGILGILVCVAVHNLVDDLFVHGIELQMALCLAAAVVLIRQQRFAEDTLTS